MSSASFDYDIVIIIKLMQSSNNDFVINIHVDANFSLHFFGCHGNGSDVFAGGQPRPTGGSKSGGRETETVPEALRKPQILLESGSAEGDTYLHHQVGGSTEGQCGLSKICGTTFEAIKMYYFVSASCWYLV